MKSSFFTKTTLLLILLSSPLLHAQWSWEDYEIGNISGYWVYSEPDPVISIPSSVNLEINKGWNMISCPYNDWLPPQDWTIFTWDSEYLEVNTNQPLVAGTAYWVYTMNSETITISGTVSSNNQYKLSEGWNLIGPYTEIKVSDFYDGDCIIYTLDSSNQYVSANTLYPGKGYWVYSDGTFDTVTRFQVNKIELNVADNSTQIDIDQTNSKKPDKLVFFIYDMDNRQVALPETTLTFTNSNEEPSGPPPGFASRSSSNTFFFDSDFGLNLKPDTQYMVQITAINKKIMGEPVITYLKSDAAEHIDITTASYSWRTSALSFTNRVEYAAYLMTKSGKIIRTYHPMGSYDDDGDLNLSSEITEDAWKATLMGNKIVVMIRAVDNQNKPLTPWKSFDSASKSLWDQGVFLFEVDLTSTNFELKAVPVNQDFSDEAIKNRYNTTHLLFSLGGAITTMPKPDCSGEITYLPECLMINGLENSFIGYTPVTRNHWQTAMGNTYTGSSETPNAYELTSGMHSFLKKLQDKSGFNFMLYDKAKEIEHQSGDTDENEPGDGGMPPSI